MNKCLEKQKLPKLTPGERGNLNGLFKKLICNLKSSYTKTLRPRWFHW